MPRNLKVLLIDDTQGFRKDFAEWLQDLGHEVVEAASSQEALQIFKSDPQLFDLALVDYALGGSGSVADGIELLRQLREIDQRLPVVVVTGFGERLISQRALQEGAFWYLEKPIDFVETEALLGWVSHYQVTSEKIEELRCQTGEAHSLIAASDLISIKSTQALFDAVQTKPLALLKANRCGILRINPETGDVLDVAGTEGILDRPIPSLLAPLVTQLLSAEKPYVVANLPQDSEIPDFRAYGACACPPQKDASEILFAIFDHPLSAEQRLGLELRLVALARIFGVALENLRNSQLLEALVNSGKELLIVRKKEQVYQIVEEQIRKNLGVSTFHLALLDRTTDTIRCVIYFHQGEDIAARIPPIDLSVVGMDQSFAVYILKTNQELPLDDTAKNPFPTRPFPVPGTETGSYFGVPLRRPDGSPFGVLAIEGEIPRSLPEPLKQALRVLATLVAPTLSRLRRAHLQEALLKELMTGEPKAVLKESLRSLWEAVNADLVLFFPYDPRRKTFGLSRMQAFPERSHTPSQAEIPLLQRLIDMPEHFLNKVSDDEQLEEAWGRVYGTRSLASVTLNPGGSDQPAGLVVVHYCRKERLFNEELKTDLARFSQFTALAAHLVEIQNRRSVAEHQRDAIERLISLSNREGIGSALSNAIRQTWPDHHVQGQLLLADRGRRRLSDPSQDSQEYSHIPFGLDLVGHVAETGEALLAQDPNKLIFYQPLFKGTQSALCLPVKLGDSLLGVLDFETPEPDFFNDEDMIFLEQIAQSIATTLVSASSKELTQKVLEAAREAARNPADGLEIVARSVHEIVTDAGGAPTSTTVFLVVDKELRLACAWPPDQRKGLWETVGSLPLEPAPGQKVGIVARAVLEPGTQFIADVTKERDYIAFDQKTHAELAVPVLSTDQSVIGVLNLEYGEPAALEKEHQSLVETLADQAVVPTILQQHLLKLAEEQKKTATAVALAFAGRRAPHRAHSLDNLERGLEPLRGEIERLQRHWAELKGKSLTGKVAAGLDQTINNISRSLKLLSIREEKGLQLNEDPKKTEFVNLREWAADIQTSRSKNTPKLETCIDLEERSGIIANRSWLTIAFDNLISNADNALHERINGLISLSVERSKEWIVITVKDNGPGIKSTILPYLFSDRIPDSLNNHGVGCLITLFIAQLYQGRLLPIRTGPEGTKISIEFPYTENGKA